MKIEFTTLEKLAALTNYDNIMMFDSETIGFYGKVRLAQFYQRNFQTDDGEPIVYLIEYPNAYELAGYLSKIEFVCHNVHYDITTVQQQMGRIAWIPEKFHCTFMLSRLHFYKQDGFSLDNVIEYTLPGNNFYAGLDKKALQKSNWAVPVLSSDQIRYSATDVVCLHDVWDAVEHKREDYSYKLDLLCIKDCLEFQNNGMPIDLVKAKAKYADNLRKIEKIALPINSNSYQQVRAYIGSNLSDDKGLSLLTIQGNTRAAEVNKTRKLIKNNSFLTKYMNNAQPHDSGDEDFGVLYGKFKPSARSGRTTSDDDNLQQIPRSLKDLFGVPENGDEILLYSDFAAIQMRAVCAVTRDLAMELLFRHGEDLHNYVAKMIFGEDFTPEHRQIAKTANFSLLFGAGVVVFQYTLLKQAGIWLTEAEAMRIIKLWKQTWKQVKEWQDKGITDWRKKIAWQTPLGRQYTAKMMTDQLAMQIQGFEAEVAKLAAHYMTPKMKAISPDIKKRNFMHDSYTFTTPNDKGIYIPAMEVIAESMQEAWIEMSTSVAIPDLPMPVKVRAGWNWGDIEKGKFVHEISR